MTPRRSALFVLSAALLVASGSLAQRGPGRGWGSGGGGRMYDPKTVTTVSGEVVSVEQVQGMGHGQRGCPGCSGVHLTLKSEKEQIAVHLGPEWYLQQHALTIAPKDHIEVRGSRITFDGAPAIIAAEVKKGDQSLELRDDAGIPAWRGQGRRAP